MQLSVEMSAPMTDVCQNSQEVVLQLSRSENQFTGELALWEQRPTDLVSCCAKRAESFQNFKAQLAKNDFKLRNFYSKSYFFRQFLCAAFLSVFLPREAHFLTYTARRPWLREPVIILFIMHTVYRDNITEYLSLNYRKV